jgi:hypothetical protein
MPARLGNTNPRQGGLYYDLLFYLLTNSEFRIKKDQPLLYPIGPSRFSTCVLGEAMKSARGTIDPGSV